MAVPAWQLSQIGRSRVEELGWPPWLGETRRVVTSDEAKAVETAGILATALGREPEIWSGLHENDRSATGYLEAAAFDAMADRFFAEPDTRVRGWESAVDAQARIVGAVQAVLDGHTGGGDVLFVGHGGVGTLLYCHHAGLPIDRRYDQPAGGGHVFAVDTARGDVLFPWRSMESL